jgi:hypothetical protein
LLYKIFLPSLFCIICQIVFAQKNLPVLKSDSTTITIKIDGNLVGIWNIDADTKPGTEPDVFRIERSFQLKKVTYSANRDSISFNVNPGDAFYFTILINNKAFPMGIATFDAPVFLHRNILIVVFFLILIASIIVFTKRKALQTKPLLYTGIIAPLFFWFATITGGFIHGGYNHLHNVVSELGAIGTRSEIFMSTSEMLLFILTTFSVIGFYKACKETGISAIPVLTILSLSVSMYWAAIFPMHHAWHGALGPIPLILNAGALLSIFIWRKKGFAEVRWISLLSFILMSLIALRTIPDLRNNYEGLTQRFFYLGWTIWSMNLALVFIRVVKIKSAQ